MLEQLLGSKLRAKVIGWLLTHPEERFSVRQLADLLQRDPTNTGRELARLASLGVLTCAVEGRQKHYQANANSPVFNELRGLALKTTGLADVVRAALEPLGDRVRLAFVFGSMARGEAGASSDVDLLVVGDVSLAELVRALGPAQTALGREVNPAVYPPGEFRSKLAQKHPFLSRAVRGPRLAIVGGERELERLAQEPLAD